MKPSKKSDKIVVPAKVSVPLIEESKVCAKLGGYRFYNEYVSHALLYYNDKIRKMK